MSQNTDFGITGIATGETLHLTLPFRFETSRSCGLSVKGAYAVNNGQAELDDVYALRPEDTDLLAYSYSWTWWLGGYPQINVRSSKQYTSEAAALRDAHKSARAWAKSLRENYS